MNRTHFINSLQKYGKKMNIPNISATNSKFLLDLIKKTGAKNLLEIGSANGLSSIIFGDYLEKINGKITTIEFSSFSVKHAQNNIKCAGLEKTIKIIEGNAFDIIPHLEEKFDFIFIDGMKKRSLDFFLICQKVKTPKATIVIDDVIKFSHKMQDLYEYIEKNKIKHKIIKTDPDDGIMVFYPE